MCYIAYLPKNQYLILKIQVDFNFTQMFYWICNIHQLISLTANTIQVWKCLTLWKVDYFWTAQHAIFSIGNWKNLYENLMKYLCKMCKQMSCLIIQRIANRSINSLCMCEQCCGGITCILMRMQLIYCYNYDRYFLEIIEKKRYMYPTKTW